MDTNNFDWACENCGESIGNSEYQRILKETSKPPLCKCYHGESKDAYSSWRLNLKSWRKRSPAENFRLKIKRAIIDFQKESDLQIDKIDIVWKSIGNVRVINAVNISIREIKK